MHLTDNASHIFRLPAGHANQRASSQVPRLVVWLANQSLAHNPRVLVSYRLVSAYLSSLLVHQMLHPQPALIRVATQLAVTHARYHLLAPVLQLRRSGHLVCMTSGSRSSRMDEFLVLAESLNGREVLTDLNVGRAHLAVSEV